MVYLGAWRFLPFNHRYRRCRATFNNAREELGIPRRRTGAEILEQGRERADWLRQGGVVDNDGDHVKQHGVKRGSILYALPYWKVINILS